MQRLLPAKTITTMEKTVRMKNELGVFKEMTIENDWDHHGSYQWTYFAEEQKRLINFFLSKTAGPRNLEIGGGWYQSYPGSTAIDVSRVCLKYNEARKKVHYDLDYLDVGFKLPFKGHSFDSATMISVWQYLENPIALLKELERVLVPGGEVYVINGQGAGVEELVKGASRSESVLELAKKCGYDALLQSIPTLSGKRDIFKSVCIAMPDNTLFGPKPEIMDKTNRANEPGDTKEFLGRYAEWELEKIRERLSQLKTYPVTEYSRHYLETCERLSQRFHEKTGRFPVLFAESHQLEVDMYAKDGFILSHELVMTDISSKGSFNEFAESFGIGFSQYYTSLRDYVRMHIEGRDILPKVKEYSDYGFEDHTRSVQERESAIYILVTFIASVPLNSYTESLQQSLLGRLEKEEPGIKKEIGEARARRLYSLCCEYKQRRRINELIRRKNSMERMEIAREANLNIKNELSHFRDFILEVPMAYGED